MVNQLPWLSAMKHSPKTSDSSFSIFYDPEGHRGPRVRGVWLALRSLSPLLTATLVASVLVDPSLNRSHAECQTIGSVLGRQLSQSRVVESSYLGIRAEILQVIPHRPEIAS